MALSLLGVYWVAIHRPESVHPRLDRPLMQELPIRTTVVLAAPEVSPQPRVTPSTVPITESLALASQAWTVSESLALASQPWTVSEPLVRTVSRLPSVSPAGSIPLLSTTNSTMPIGLASRSMPAPVAPFVGIPAPLVTALASFPAPAVVAPRNRPAVVMALATSPAPAAVAPRNRPDVVISERIVSAPTIPDPPTQTARPLYLSANAAGAVTTFDVNAFLGAGTFYALGVQGQNARVANIEGGTAFLGHEVFAGLAGTQFRGSANTALIGSDAVQDHATGVSHAILGRGAGLQQQGIAHGVGVSGSTGRFYTGNIATSFDSGGSFNTSLASEYTAYRDAMISGINGVSTQVVDVINSSWGYTDATGSENGDLSRYSDALLVTANNGVGVTRRGVSIVYAAGNEGPGANTVGGPASGYNSIVVGALGPYIVGHTPYSVASSFSSRGPQDVGIPSNAAGSNYTTVTAARNRVDIAAPGEQLYLAYSATGTTTYSSIDGTSFAAPTVAGGVALLADRARSVYASQLNDALDGRVVKAVLMNSADKTARWNSGATGGLDPATGAGRMNLDQARYQLDTGYGNGFSAMPAANSSVAATGWTRQTSAGISTNQTYSITTSLSKYDDLSATVSWYVNRVLTSVANGTTTEGSFHNLNLRVWRLSGPGGTQVSIVGSSASLYNTSEHASFLVPSDGYYQIEVQQSTANWNFDGSTTVIYGLAWATRSSTNIGSGTTNVSASTTSPNLLVAPDVGQTATVNVSGGSTTYRTNKSAYIGGANSTVGGTGTLNVTGGATLQISDTLRVFAGGTVNIDNATVSGGYLDLAAVGATISSANSSTLGFTGINSAGGSILATSGTLTLPGFTNSDGANVAAITSVSGLTFGGAGNVVVGGIVGGGAISKVGGGTVTLTAVNTYTGGTTVSAGALQFNASTAIGGTGANVKVAAGATAAAGYAINQTFLTRIDPTSAGVVALAGVASSNALTFSTLGLTGVSLGATIAATYSGTLTPAGGAYRLGGGGGTLTVSSTLSGANALTAFGSGTVGTVILTSAASYTGPTSLRDGEFRVTGAGRLPSSTVVTLGAATTPGRLVLGDATAAVPQTVAGLGTTGLGGAIVGGNVSNSVLTVNAAADQSYAGALGGAGANENKLSLAKTGTANLTLLAANTFTGGTTVNGGTLTAAASGSLGSGSVAVTSAKLLASTGATVGNAVTLAAGGGGGGQTVNLQAWDLVGQNSGPVTVATTAFDAGLKSTPTYNTLTRGPGAAASTASNSFRTVGFQNNGIALTNTDYFQWIVGSTQSYSLTSLDARYAGTATFSASPGVTMQFAYSTDGTTFSLIGSPFTTIGTPATMPQIDLSGVSALQALAAGTDVTFRFYASGQTTTGGWGFSSQTAAGTNALLLRGAFSGGAAVAPTFGSAATSGTVTFAGSITLSADANVASAAGGTVIVSGPVGESGGAYKLTKVDAGIVILSGANTYTSATTVSAGTLLVDGQTGTASGTGTGSVTVSSGATLGGTGRISGAITVAGNLTPTTLTVASTVNFSSGSKFFSTLNGTLAGSGYTQLIVAAGGSINLSNATLEGLVSSFTPTSGNQFFIIDNQNPLGGLSNTFTNGSTVTLSDFTFAISYAGDYGSLSTSGGNDVVLYNATPVPEPVGLLGIVGGAFWLRQRWKRRVSQGLPLEPHSISA